MSDSQRPVLYQFAFSHYNEKVRWALDFKGIAREDRALLPGFHERTVKRLSGGPTSTPVLAEGVTAIVGSAAIVRHLEARQAHPALFPKDGAARGQVEAWIEWLDDEVGPAVRLALFHELLADPGFASKIFTTSRSGLKASMYRVLFPRLVPMLRGKMSIDEESAARARHTIDDAIERVADAVADTGYLVGDAFTAADLTAGSLLFPLYFPEQLEFALPAPRSAVMDSWLARWKGAPVEAYIRRLFEKHRQGHPLSSTIAP